MNVYLYSYTFMNELINECISIHTDLCEFTGKCYFEYKVYFNDINPFINSNSLRCGRIMVYRGNMYARSYWKSEVFVSEFPEKILMMCLVYMVAVVSDLWTTSSTYLQNNI